MQRAQEAGNARHQQLLAESARAANMTISSTVNAVVCSRPCRPNTQLARFTMTTMISHLRKDPSSNVLVAATCC